MKIKENKMFEIESRLLIDMKHLDIKIKHKTRREYPEGASYSWYYNLNNHPRYAQIRLSNYKPTHFTDRIYYINVADALETWELIRYNIRTEMYRGFEREGLQRTTPAYNPTNVKLINKCLRVLNHELYYSERKRLESIKHKLLTNLTEELTLTTPYGQLFLENGEALGRYVDDGHEFEKINYKHPKKKRSEDEK